MSAAVVGLTGGVASGKSRVAARLASHGVPIEDADLVAREVVAPGQAALDEIVAAFGAVMLRGDGTLDRAAMRERVFADATARRRLEAILHPRIGAELAARAARWSTTYGVLVIPLLAEHRRDYHWLDAVVVVDAPLEQRRARLMARDGVDAALAANMIAAQVDDAARRAIADEIVRNDADLAALDREADALHSRLLARFSRRP